MLGSRRQDLYNRRAGIDCVSDELFAVDQEPTLLTALSGRLELLQLTQAGARESLDWFVVTHGSPPLPPHQVRGRLAASPPAERGERGELLSTIRR